MDTQFLYRLYDCKADAYLPPAQFRNDECAKRAICNSILNEELKNSDDYTLFRVAEADEKTGVVEGHGFVNLGNCYQLAQAVVLQSEKQQQAAGEEMSRKFNAIQGGE